MNPAVISGPVMEALADIANELHTASLVQEVHANVDSLGHIILYANITQDDYAKLRDSINRLIEVFSDPQGTTRVALEILEFTGGLKAFLASVDNPLATELVTSGKVFVSVAAVHPGVQHGDGIWLEYDPEFGTFE